MLYFMAQADVYPDPMQVRLNGGAWVAATQPATSKADADVAPQHKIVLPPGTTTIEVRPSVAVGDCCNVGWFVRDAVVYRGL